MMRKGKAENLIPIGKRTKAEQRAITVAGGKASGKARREKRTMRQLALMVKEELVETDGVTMTHGQAAILSAWREAERGNIQAHRFICDLLGETPQQAEAVAVCSPIVLGTIPLAKVEAAKAAKAAREAGE